MFNEGARATRAVAENMEPGTNIGAAFTATDPDSGDTLTYSLHRGDRDSFRIDSNTGQLQTRAALDYETKNTYDDLAVRVTDSSGLTDAILVTINVTDGNDRPAFNGTGRSRFVAENTAPGTNIGKPYTATDPEGDTLTYSMYSGEDRKAFSIVSTTGHIQTKDALDFETKNVYHFIISVSDGNGGSTARLVTINVTDVDETPVNNAPIFTEGDSTTRTVAENTAGGVNIGTPVAATDADTGDTLTCTLDGPDASSFNINGTTGQLRTNAALDYETKSSYSVTVSVSDGNDGSDSIDVTINVTNVNEAPSFATSTATRSIAENTAPNTNIGSAFAATDVDANTTLTYSLSGADASSFSIDSGTGQLKTSDALDYETDDTYEVTVTATDSGSLTDTITVTINVTNVNEAPAFSSGATIANISATKDTPITSVALPEATDPDASTTLIYTLTPALPTGLTFTASTRILAGTPTAESDSATYTYTASDNTLSDTLTFTIEVAAPNNPPVFTDGTSTTRSVPEDMASGQNIGTLVGATDANNDTLTYTLSGTDAASFSIVSTTGQLQTKAALNRQTKVSHSVTVSVSDGNGGTDSIDVIINVTAPCKPVNQRSPRVRDAIVAAIPGVDSAADVTPAHLAAITTLKLISFNKPKIEELRDGDFDCLTSLTHLDLSYNRISNLSPLQHLTSLTELNLDFNSISDISVLQHLTSLTELGLGSTSISDISVLQHLTKLTKLYLNSTSISNISVLQHLTSLTHLNLVATSVSDISVLQHLTSLTGLGLGSTSISDISVLQHLTSLTELGLGSTSISDISVLQHLTKLTRLYLDENSISDISVLQHLTKLTELRLHFNSIRDASALEQLTSLTELWVRGNPISDYGPLRRLKTAIEAAGSTIDIDIDINNNPPAAPSVETPPAIPEKTVLLTNYPNPFNPETWIPYQLSEPAEVTLTIYNMRGVVVRELKLGHQAAGMYQSRSRAIHWDGRNMFGEKVATGVYFYTFKAGEFSATRKMLIRK